MDNAGEGTIMPEPQPMPQVGDLAPGIDAGVTGDGRFVLAEQHGKWVVIYFFPRSNTPG